MGARVPSESPPECLRNTQRGAADARRDRKLARLGFRVVRVEAEMVLRNLPVAVELVRRGLAQEASTPK